RWVCRPEARVPRVSGGEHERTAPAQRRDPGDHARVRSGRRDRRHDLHRRRHAHRPDGEHRRRPLCGARRRPRRADPARRAGEEPFLVGEISWQADLPMAPQARAWTCAACALDWVLRATGLDPYSTRDQVVRAIGYPHNINEAYGLMDAGGSALRDVYALYEQATEQGWLGFDDVYALAQHTTGQISGMAYYHWVAIRGVTGDALWIANSAPGYKGIYDV